MAKGELLLRSSGVEDMRNLKTGLALIFIVALTAGCLESQPTPDITKRPSTDFTLVRASPPKAAASHFGGKIVFFSLQDI